MSSTLNLLDLAFIGSGVATVGGFADHLVSRWRNNRQVENSRDAHDKIETVVQHATQELRAELTRRFDSNDTITELVKEDVTKIKATVFPNGGQSMADRLQRVEVTLGHLSGSLDAYAKSRNG